MLTLKTNLHSTSTDSINVNVDDDNREMMINDRRKGLFSLWVFFANVSMCLY